ncbi:hypothetical protein RB647_07700 [Staphylococcus aureus]|nr:hypothetical protein [Staphylococcus aureus]MDQ4661203.1 hypothetical protein [Staphylococcus aureus]
MAQRYIKVLILYIFTTLLSSITVTSKCVPNKVVRFILRTVVGYSVFLTNRRAINPTRSL